jgi:hypothetical protein
MSPVTVPPSTVEYVPFELWAIRGTGWFSRVIRLVTLSDCSHVAAVFVDAAGRAVGVEAYEGVGVRTFNPAARASQLGDRLVRLRWRIPVSHSLEIADFVAREHGAPYDYGGIVRFVLPTLRPSATRWYCSELGEAICRLARIAFPHDQPRARWSPARLARSLHARRVWTSTAGYSA